MTTTVNTNQNPLQCIAKSNKVGNQVITKTLEEHTKDLMDQYKLLKQIYNITNQELTTLLKYAVQFHDYGKANQHFQNKIQNGKKHPNEIPHHFLSPLFFLSKHQDLSSDQKQVITYAIISHHAKGKEILFWKDHIRTLIENIVKLIQQEHIYGTTIYENINTTQIGVKDVVGMYYSILNSISDKIPDDISDDMIKRFILTAGLLIRIDHAASAECEVEEEPIEKNREDIFLDYLERKNKERKNKEEKALRPFQEAFKDVEGNLVVVADTGLGKTGLAALWAKRKMFYVLPNRASVNAMYENLKEIFGEDKVGLLHSNSLFYLLENSDDKDEDTIEEILKEHQSNKMLSKPVIVTTADQLFTAVFKYPTYEKIYATLAYSDIVIDEIQGFDPYQIVPMLKQIEETIKLGARYLIITATLPANIKSELKRIGFAIEDKNDNTKDNTKRHKIEILDSSITDNHIINMIVKQAQQEKHVLVIANTVKTAQELYSIIKKQYPNTKLLHANFIWKDRQKKEKEIMEDFSKEDGVVWISTQLVEVSLDIDFDVLFTEAAPADSLIQRMGRVWRHRTIDYSQDEPNIYITKFDENLIKDIYDMEIVRETIKLIKEHIQNTQDGTLLSEQKRKIVEELYSDDKLGKYEKYSQKWKEAQGILEYINMFKSDIPSKDQAHKMFRDSLTVEVVPKQFEEKIIDLLKQYEQAKNKNDLAKKYEVLLEIQKYKVPIHEDAFKRTKVKPVREKSFVLIADIQYDDNIGIVKKSNNNHNNTFEFI